MPRSSTTGIYTPVVNSFSDPVIGEVIDPVDAQAFWDDLSAALNDLPGRLNPNPPMVNVKDYGATGDGVTDDTTALNAARIASQTLGAPLFFPAGTYLVSSDTALFFTAGPAYLIGAGFGSAVIKAKDSAALSGVVTGDVGVTMIVNDITIDGNFSGGGTAAVLSYGLAVQGPNSIVRAEIKNVNRDGIWIVGADNATIAYCYVHDNVATGITSVGATVPYGLNILGGVFEDNYNHSVLSDSAAINVKAQRPRIIGVRLKNNLNINGGQLVVTDGSDGSGKIYGVIADCTIEQTVTAGDNTSGIEASASAVNIHGNVLVGIKATGIVAETGSTSTDIVISNNIISATEGGIRTLTNVTGVSITGNRVRDALLALSLQTTNPTGNDISIRGNDWSNCTAAYDTSLTKATYVSGNTPNNGGFAQNFPDASFFIQDDGDATKQLQFQASGITTGTTRTLISPNASGIIGLTGSTTGSAALTKVDDTNVTLTLGGSPSTALLNATSITVGWTSTLALSRLAQGTDGQIIVGQTSASPLYKTVSGDWTLSAAGAATLATVNSNVGTFGSATQSVQFTVNGKGLVTAAANVTVTPAVGSITGLGTGVATALAINVGSAGAPVTFNGAGGTPSSLTLTSATGLPISSGVSGLGTGIATALAVNVGTAGAPVINGGALGSPSSAGTLPAHTLGGTVSGGGNQINNVIIGTSTPLAGSFTTVNRVTITAPATSATLTITDAKALNVSNTVTLAGTDGSTLNFGAGGTITYTPIKTVTKQVLTGTATYTPTANCVFAIVELVGGGGGGGGAANSSASQIAAGGGGGGGGYARKVIAAPTAVTLTIGAAGTAATAGNNAGGTGGTTSYGAVFTATGGTGGGGSATGTSSGATSSGLGSAGGSGSSGDINLTGSAGTSAIWSTATNGLFGISGAGGLSAMGFGGGGVSAVSQGAGDTGKNYGGGGAGGFSFNAGGTAAGGAGAAGIAIITEFLSS